LSSRRVLPAVLAFSLLLALPAGAQAKPLKAPAKKFLAQQQGLQQRFAPKQSQMLAAIAAKRKDMRACPVLSNLPDDNYEQIISYLYVLLDMMQEATAPLRDDFVFAARSYQEAAYGDSVLNRAARARYRYLRTLSDLKPFDSCAVLGDWAQASWPTDWKPTGETWEAVRAIYYPDVQVPDESALRKRLRKLGASSRQRSRTKNVAISERVFDGFQAVLDELFPRVDIQWR